MTQPVLCIYRADDPDTLLAAWAVHRALPNAEFIAARRGEDFALDPTCKRQISARDILILGDLYPLPTLRAVAAEARSVLVLAGDEKNLKSLMAPPHWLKWRDYKVWTDIRPQMQVNIAAILNPSRAICGIAWNYLHPGIPRPGGPSYGRLPGEDVNKRQPDPIRYGPDPRPRIINLIEDHALGRFSFGDETRAFVAVLRSYDWTDLPAMFERLDEWHFFSQGDPNDVNYDDKWGDTAWQSLLAEGRAILRAERQRLAREGAKK